MSTASPAGPDRATGVRAVVEVLARAMTDRPEMVRVTESQHKQTTLVELFVSAQDVGKLIGRQGRTVAALRTLASIAAEREGKTVTLEIREEGGREPFLRGSR